MTITLPIYIEEHSRGAGEAPLFVLRPLHRDEPMRKSEKLSRALAQMQSDLQTKLLELSQDTRHDELAHWSLLPDYDTRTLDLRIELKSGPHLRRFFLAGYEALGRKLWFTPRLSNVHFEVLKDQRLNERAVEVLTQHFREMEKKGDGVDLDDYALPQEGKARLTVLEVKIKPALNALKAKPARRASIFGGSDKKPDGEAELRKVGRLLNSMYPDDLPRATGRETEVADLERWLRLPDKRALLLVGPRQVGKSALVQEFVWRMMADKAWTKRRNVWLVSPMRLISGMSYVGQWQNRVQAICEHVEKNDAVLYLDDLPGLFTAGQSANSDLSVAQLLKPRLEKRSLRLLAEITPESWRVLRERDRTFADLFHVVPVTEPGEADTLRILVSAAREMERQHDCAFSIEVVPAVYELHRRFASDAAFPGKAAGFLQRLSVKHAGGTCDRHAALEEFRERSGLHLSMLDSTQALSRESIVNDLLKHVSGQDEVLHAFADVLIKLKARLNDPRRPLAAFLLLGPTGVGKTQCAKALAQHLFGSADRLLRFDMNEMVDSTAVPRLTGTPGQPDGLLTGAVRRQPFSVVLFDEIEKAAPEVFDMLLGVLDEGRLSDALGRVADFTSCVILLTSNLGVREAGSRIGFGGVQETEMEAAYVKAAEKFFRPEFFNRLDRVLPFRELKREHLAEIANRLLADVLKRDGLRQRQCLFDFTAAAAERLVELGHHPQLGARALKRVIEREVAQPLAADLAARTPGIPLRIELRCADQQFTLHTRELRPVERTVFWPEQLSRGGVPATAVLDAAYDALGRLTDSIEAHAPGGKVELDALTQAQERYYHCREQVRRVERVLQAAENSLKARPVSSSRVLSVSRARPVKIVVRQYLSGNPRFDRAREAELHQSELADLDATSLEIAETPVFACVRELSLLELMTGEPHDYAAVGLVIRGKGPRAMGHAKALQERVLRLLSSHWGCEVKPVGALADSLRPFQTGIWTAGLNVARLLEPLRGCWLLEDDGSLQTLEVQRLTCATANELAQRLAQSIPVEEAPVVMTARSNHQILSHHTGLAVQEDADEDGFRAFHLSALPLPEELDALFQSPN
ncbi:MAG: ATP-dependent Clp protease ATP-binding subunit [Prosthecobacter sp.]|jgi:ATP-dependent Clp protease ATP-binding subunit ClpC|uniref:AAA family ATPase n=1 Tax=Prosthecobacter sp. TaxID=1965333 RepID=UPI001A100BBA|nr:AAA family ATPase [Prosthecobacter sp.]MBE2284156.1 ATP-dependent Clp protease ATP-binding subunit [Prosthecobacter sp.]